MSYVFISYKREDELRAGRIARALENAGVPVWWDRGLPGGESWHTNIESKLQQAGCVIVVWSENSAGSDGGYVREEARRGLARNILVPVLIHRLANLPLGFGEIQALDLTDWRGNPNDTFFQDLLATVRAKLGGSQLPAPRGPARRVAKRLMWGGASTAGLLFIALFAFNTFGMTTKICELAGPQPALSDSCGNFGLGGRPSRSERLAWETRMPGSCSALRDHIAQFPDGALRSKAADLLTGRRVSSSETWQPSSRALALFEPAGGDVARDEPAAQVRALQRAKADAVRLCRGFGAAASFRFVAASPVAERWQCAKGRSGVSCGFEGHAQCDLEQRQVVEREDCG